MGNATVRQTPAGQSLNQDYRIFMQVDLPKFVTHSRIGNGKFMKTYLMRVESTQVVVKVYMKLPDEDLSAAAKALTSLWNTIPPTKYPNLMPYQMWIRSTPKSKASPAPAYLIRQYFNANLYDRLSTRPFLNELEKYWIIFQLLKCLEICHEHGVVHGDIKPENVMCTTSNWIVLTDFSPFKPVMLPDDDLTDFKYFFDAMARDHCYIAQERFYRNHVERWNKPTTQATDASKNVGKKTPTLNKPSDTKPQLLPSMDVFSAGCIMAEILMDGTPLFDLPGMLQYVSSPLEMLANANTSQFGSNSSTPIPPSTPSTNNNPPQQEEITAKQLLARIRNPQLKAVIASMTRKDADKRLSAADYLKILQGKIAVEQLATDKHIDRHVIPEYFESCIYPLYLKLHWNGVTPDDRVMIVCESFGDIVQQVCHGVKDVDGARFFSSAKTDAPLVLASLLSLENRSHEVLLPAVGIEISCPSHSQTLCGPSLQQATSTAGVRSSGGQRHRTDAEHRALKEAKWPSSISVEDWPGKGSVKCNSNGRVKVNEDSVLLLSVKEQRQLTAGQLLQRARAQLHDLELLERGEDHWEQSFLDTSHVKQPEHDVLTGDGASGNVKTRLIAEDKQRLQQSLAETLHLLQVSLDRTTQNSDGFFSPPPKQQQAGVDLGDNDNHSAENPGRAQYEGLVLVVDIICANYRHLKLLSSRVLSLLLLGRLGALCTDAIILQRIVPVLLIATEDAAPQVRVLALRCLSALTSLVRHIEPIEVGFFPQYVFSALSRLAKDQELLVKLAFAQCLGTIACTAKRFLVLGHRLHADKILREQANASGIGNTNNNNSNTDSAASESQTANAATTSGQPQWPANAVLDFPYDSKLEQLKEQVSRWIRDLILDPASAGFGMSAMHTQKAPQSNLFNSSSANGIVPTHASPETSVKKVLLIHVLELSDFFGQESTMDKLLTQLLTFLNDQDSELRELFCRQVSRLGLLLGLSVTSEYIVPCLENVLYDVEEKVAVAAVESLAALVSAGLVAHYWLLDFCRKATALLLHPSVGLRSAGIAFFSTAARSLGVLDTAIMLLPLLRPFLADEVAKACCNSASTGMRSFSRHSSDSEDNDNEESNKVTMIADPPDTSDTTIVGGSAAASLSLAEAIQQPTQLRFALKTPLQMHHLHLALRKQLLSISVQHNANSSNVEELNALNETSQDTVVQQKLSLLQSYLTHTAREAYTKSLRWRHAASSQMQQLLPTNSNNTAASSTSSGRRPTFPVAAASSSANANNNSVNSNNSSNSNKTLGVLQWSLTHATVLDSHYHSSNNNSSNNNSVQTMSHLMSVAVPTMRAGVYVSEDLRRQHIYLDNDEERNLRKLRMLFLAYPVNNNATINSPNNNTMENTESYYDNLVQNEYYGGGNVTNGNNNSLGAGANVAGSPDTYDTSANANSASVKRYYYYGGNNDSVTLLRRLRGLQVPPVCIDLGTPLATNEELKLLQDTNTLLSLGIFSAVNVNSAATGGGINSLNNANNVNPTLSNNLAGLSIALNNANLDVLDAASQQQLQQQLQLQVALYNLNNSNNNNNTSSNNANNVNFAVAAAAGAVTGVADPSLIASAAAGSGASASNSGNVNSGIVNSSNANNANVGGSRKEREGVLLMTLREHSAAVHRLVVSSDMSYFCSASADGTVKVWQTRMLDRVAFPRSAGTYAGHKGPVLDAVAVEQSHSVCSASKDGTVHVWRVDLSVSPNNGSTANTVSAGNTYGAYVQPSGGTDANNANSMGNNNTNSSVSVGNANSNGSNANDFHFLHPNASYAYASVRGASLLRVLNPDEGAVTAVQHFNSEVASVVLFGSQRGVVHAWDLRMSREAFNMTLRPEMGSLSALTVGPDRHWVAAGTSKGVVALWDVRFNVLSAAWRHSSGSAIQRLACCKAPRSVVPGLGYTEGVFLFCAAGNNEAAIFGLPEGGECAKCFRSVPMNESRAPVTSLPSLQPLHLAQLHNPHLFSQPYNAYLTGNNPVHSSHVVRAMLGRVSPNNPSHLVTAGSDRCIRFWDFQQPSQCFTIAGSEPTQPRAQFRAVKTEVATSLGSGGVGNGVVAEYSATPATFANAPNLMGPTTSTTNKLLVCYTSALPSPDKILQSQLPVRENRGLSTPSVNNRDGILDLKDIELPQRLLLSSARDGEIKMWKVLL